MLELAVDLCSIFDKDEHSVLMFSFWGGEPFMNAQFVKQLVDQTKDFQFTRYHIYTNGILTDELDSFLNFAVDASLEDRIDMQFSYDGEPHNSLKRHNDGKTTIQNAKKFIQSGFDVDFKATLSYDMISKLPEIWESYRLLHDEIGRCASYGPTIDMSADNGSYISEWKEAVREVMKKEKHFIMKHGYPLMTWLNDYQKRSCSIDNTVHLHSDGKMYICHGCPYSSNAESKSYGSFMDIDSLAPYLKNYDSSIAENAHCTRCGAVYCAVCHAMNSYEKTVSKNIQQWNKCKSNSEERCLYYQYFSYMAAALKYALICNSTKSK